MGNGKIKPLAESKPFNRLIRNCEYRYMITSERYTPISTFVKISSTGATGESGEI